MTGPRATSPPPTRPHPPCSQLPPHTLPYRVQRPLFSLGRRSRTTQPRAPPTRAPPPSTCLLRRCLIAVARVRLLRGLRGIVRGVRIGRRPPRPSALLLRRLLLLRIVRGVGVGARRTRRWSRRRLEAIAGGRTVCRRAPGRWRRVRIVRIRLRRGIAVRLLRRRRVRVSRRRRRIGIMLRRIAIGRRRRSGARRRPRRTRPAVVGPRDDLIDHREHLVDLALVTPDGHWPIVGACTHKEMVG